MSGGFVVTPDNVPPTGLAGADLSLFWSKLATRFFGRALRHEDDLVAENRRFDTFLSPSFLGKQTIEMNIQSAIVTE